MPQWQTLPEGTQQALTALIVQLLVDQANDESASQSKEAGMMHEKISALHLECEAILCVRQSSAHPVLHSRESSALQYWPAP